MFPYKEKKIINAITYIAQKHKQKTRRNLYQTALYKYLGFIDFTSIKEVGRPVTGLHYKAMEKGPVPIEIYFEKEYRSTDLYDFKEDQYGVYIDIKKKKCNMDYFSDYEIQLLNNYIEIFAVRYVNSNMMSDASHKNIFAWKRVYNKTPNENIKYSDEFPGDIHSYDIDKLTLPQESYLIFTQLANIE